MPDTTNGTQTGGGLPSDTVETETAETPVPNLLDTLDRFGHNQTRLSCIIQFLSMVPRGLELSKNGKSGLFWILNDIETEYTRCVRDIERIHGHEPEDEE